MQIPLSKIIDGDLKYCDPYLRQATWQCVSALHYRPLVTWETAYNRKVSANDYIDNTVYVPGTQCFYTHSYISIAHIISICHKNNIKYESHDVLHNFMNNAIENIKKSLFSNGAVSRMWVRGVSRYPISRQELVILNGHTLEWLSIYLDQKHISDPWVYSIANILAAEIIASYEESFADETTITDLPLEYESLCHAAKALKTYCIRLSNNRK